MKRSQKPSRATSAHADRISLAFRKSTRAIVVQKFGGTSVGTIARIEAVARRAIAAQKEGRDVVLVVSAMAGETNRLLGLAREISAAPERRELDVVATSGEQVAVGLVALAIQAGGGRAQSMLGHQLPIVTDDAHGEARVLSVGTERIRSLLAAGVIPVIAGFQGVTPAGAIATLGRGGSDTTAVAVAAALAEGGRADVECEIYTDVDGVFSADPNVCPNARLIPRMSLAAMFALARHGAKVLHPRCVAIAKAHGVTVHVRSSFSDQSGTILVDESIERPAFAGVALDRNVVLVHVEADSTAETVRLLAALAERQVSFEIASRAGDAARMSVALPRADLGHAKAALEDVGASFTVDAGLAKVSLVGSGLSAAPILQRFMHVALTVSVVPTLVQSDDVSIRCLLPEADANTLLIAIHDSFVVPPQAHEVAAQKSA